MRSLALVLLLCSCGDSSSADDMNDASVPADLSVAPDLSVTPDLSVAPDLGIVPDLQNPDLTPPMTTLTSSVASLALSVTGLTEYGVSGTPASGLARTITVTNTGSVTAMNLSIAYPTWPSGTTATSTCGSSLAASASCTITITPGSTATSLCSGGTAPTPGTITIGADNTSQVKPTVVVLSYGCIYQGGYVFAFDDTKPATASVGGRVATSADQSTGIIWSSNGAGAYDNGISIYGISNTSTSVSPSPSSGLSAGQSACNGSTDGTCDTNNIYVYYQNAAVGAPIPLASYAAGLCRQTLGSYSDWQLPAICEMGYDATTSNTGCGTSVSPTRQNMQSALVDFNGLALLSGNYFSATESSTTPQTQVWAQHFGSGTSQVTVSKGGPLNVRCARAF
jgi:hypothetical protein